MDRKALHLTILVISVFTSIVFGHETSRFLVRLKDWSLFYINESRQIFIWRVYYGCNNVLFEVNFKWNDATCFKVTNWHCSKYQRSNILKTQNVCLFAGIMLLPYVLSNLVMGGSVSGKKHWFQWSCWKKQQQQQQQQHSNEKCVTNQKVGVFRCQSKKGEFLVKFFYPSLSIFQVCIYVLFTRPSVYPVCMSVSHHLLPYTCICFIWYYPPSVFLTVYNYFKILLINMWGATY